MYLITGGAGYIGTHVSLALLQQGAQVVILDDFSNSTRLNVDTLSTMYPNLTVINGSVTSLSMVESVFIKYDIQKVIHLAARKSIDNSYKQEELYLETNYLGTQNLIEACLMYGVNDFVFMSTSGLYASSPVTTACDELYVISPYSNPYNFSKYKSELLLKRMTQKRTSLNVVTLRLFNPAGLSSTGLLVEEDLGGGNLFPNIVKCMQLKEPLTVYGDAHIRDFVHIEDVVAAVLRSLEYKGEENYNLFNIGTGTGHHVFDVINEFNKQKTGCLNYIYGAARTGDGDGRVANPQRALDELNWKTKYDLADIVKSIIDVDNEVNNEY